MTRHAPPPTKYGAPSPAQAKPAQARPVQAKPAQAKPQAAAAHHAPPPTRFAPPPAQAKAAPPAQPRHAPPPTRFAPPPQAQAKPQDAAIPRQHVPPPQPWATGALQLARTKQTARKSSTKGAKKTTPKRIAPHGKVAREAFGRIKLRLLDRGIAYHGLKSRYYIPRLKSTTLTSISDFEDIFVQEIDDILQIELKRKKANKKYKMSVRPFKMNRPAWPKDYRGTLGAKPGDDIRHVVRNATLKNAIEGERFALSLAGKSNEEMTAYFRDMAKYLGVAENAAADHYLEYMKAVYNRAYLNLGNLFPGPGGVNQAIGFTADPLATLAEQLQNQLVPVDIATVIGQIKKEFDSKINQIKNKSVKMPTHYIDEFQRYTQTIYSFLQNLQAYWIDNYALDDPQYQTPHAYSFSLARDVYDISDNLGMDLIDAVGTQDQKERHKVLIETETALRGFYTRGDHSLTKILYKFLSIA